MAAVDLETARQAARLIDISYEELPAVFDTDAATAADAPALHEGFADYIKVFEADSDRNAMAIIEIVEGDVESAWESCAAIVEGSYETQAQCHTYMEPCSALAEIDSNGKITIWSSNQSVFHVQSFVADSLGLRCPSCAASPRRWAAPSAARWSRPCSPPPPRWPAPPAGRSR